MAGRGGRRGRGGARGGSGGTSPNLNLQMRSPDDADEPSAKKAKEEAADDELSDLLNQPREILVQIVNHLEPDDFREFAHTCHYFYNFCMKFRGINIVFPVERVQLTRGENNSIKFYHIHEPDSDEEDGSGDDHSSTPTYGDDHHRCFFPTFLKKLRMWPFSIHIDVLDLNGEEMTRPIKDYFDRKGVKKIRCLESAVNPQSVQDVEYFTNECIKVFDIQEVLFDCRGLSKEITEALLKMPLAKVVFGDVGESDHPDFRCSIPVVSARDMITRDEFPRIIEMWSTENLEKWEFEGDDHENIIYINHFLECFTPFEIRNFNYNGPIDRRNPPVFLDMYDDLATRTVDVSVYMLRKDGKIVSITFHLVEEMSTIVFSMCPIDEAPRALRKLLRKR